MTPVEAARFLMMSPNNVYRLVRSGEIPSVKNGREYLLEESDVREWKENRKAGEWKKKQGVKWRTGLILSRRNWRCGVCLTINLRDQHQECRKCGRAMQEQGKQKPEKR